MIGVFLSFTLSQTGMFFRWRRQRPPGWSAPPPINGIGAVLTGVVLIIVAITKGPEGAWIVIVLDSGTRRALPDHGSTTTRWPAAHPARLDAAGRRTNVVLVPISGVQRAVVQRAAVRGSISDRRACGVRQRQSGRLRR